MAILFFAMALCLSEKVSVGPRLSPMALNHRFSYIFSYAIISHFYIIHANF